MISFLLNLMEGSSLVPLMNISLCHTCSNQFSSPADVLVLRLPTKSFTACLTALYLSFSLSVSKGNTCTQNFCKSKGLSIPFRYFCTIFCADGGKVEYSLCVGKPLKILLESISLNGLGEFVIKINCCAAVFCAPSEREVSAFFKFSRT